MTNEQEETGRIPHNPLEMWDSRYSEYLTLCTNGDVTPMEYDAWLEWDEHVYQKHVREAANPLSPATFQRMQKPENKKPVPAGSGLVAEYGELTVLANNRPHEDTLKNVQTMSDILESLQLSEDACDSLRSQLENLTEENESLIEDLAKADARNAKLVNEARDAVSQMALLSDQLESQKHDLWKRIEEAQHSRSSQREQHVKYYTQQEEEINNLRAQLHNLTEENRELNCGLNTLNIEADDLGASKQDLEKRLSESQQLAKVLRAENELLNQENEELTTDHEGLEEPVDPACDLHRMIELFNKCGEAGITVEQAIEKASREVLNIPANQPLYPHYFREVPRNTTHVDISWVLRAWDVPCCEGHAIKKLMAAGKRGAKDRIKDLNEARDSITRAIELEETK